MTTKYIFVLNILKLAFAADIEVSKFKFIGYRNVWHTGQDHRSLRVGDFEGYDPRKGLDWKELDDIRRKKIVELCANQCAMYRDSCDAFYVKLRGDGTNCHMVEESDTKRTIGYGQDRLDVYYVKQQIGNSIVKKRPPGLEPPCDQDDTELTEDMCNSTIPKDVLHTYQCDEMQDTYTGTTRIIPDHKCPGEDRILVCELEGYVTSNINIQTRLDLLTIAFLKTYQNENPFRSVEQDMIEFMEMIFPHGPREVKRIIIRSATDPQVHKLKEGKLTFYQGKQTAEIPFELETEDTCIVHINLDGAVNATKTIVENTDKIRMDIISVHKMTEPVRTGFKIDVFVNELTPLEAPPTTANPNSDPSGNTTIAENVLS